MYILMNKVRLGWAELPIGRAGPVQPCPLMTNRSKSQPTWASKNSCWGSENNVYKMFTDQVKTIYLLKMASMKIFCSCPYGKSSWINGLLLLFKKDCKRPSVLWDSPLPWSWGRGRPPRSVPITFRPPYAPAQEEVRGGPPRCPVQSGPVHHWARFLGPRVLGGRSGPGQFVQAGVGGVRILLWPGHAGAAHGHGDVLLDVDGATTRAAWGPAQDHRGYEHWGAAQAHVLLPAWPSQAAPAQAVGLGQVPREAARVVGDPAGRGLRWGPGHTPWTAPRVYCTPRKGRCPFSAQSLQLLQGSCGLPPRAARPVHDAQTQVPLSIKVHAPPCLREGAEWHGEGGGQAGTWNVKETLNLTTPCSSKSPYFLVRRQNLSVSALQPRADSDPTSLKPGGHWWGPALLPNVPHVTRLPWPQTHRCSSAFF